VTEGKLGFNARLLRIEEFLNKPKTFTYIDVNKNVRQIELEKDSLAFTYCQIPIIYKLAVKEGLKVVLNGDSELEFDHLNLDAAASKKVFERTGEIIQIIVSINK